MERRSVATAPTIQQRSEEDKESRTVEGYAALYNSPSELLYGEFTERIAPGAFDGVIEQSDVKAWLNHNSARGILARSVNGEGSLTLELDDKGLKYRFEAPHMPLGDELLEGLKRGDITGSSFAFTVVEDTWTKLDNGLYERTINKIDRLYDVSPVYDPAYKETSVALRSLEAVKADERRTEEDVTDTDNTSNNNNKAIFYL